MLKIFTLSWNGRDKLQKLYPTLISSLSNIDYEWYIKDNGSKDDTISLSKCWNNNKVHIIGYSHNMDNFSKGCNFLFKEAAPKDDDLILLLNNDIYFNDTASLSSMIDLIEKDTDIGVVGAKLLFPDTNKLQHAGVVFDPIYKTPTHFRLGEVPDKNSDKNRIFQAVTGAVWLTKSKYYQNICKNNSSKLNGFDESFIWSFDDIDACLSINYHMKKKIVYCGNTNICHEQSATLKKNPANKLFINHNLLYLFDKWKKTYVIDGDIYRSDARHNLYRG